MGTSEGSDGNRKMATGAPAATNLHPPAGLTPEELRRYGRHLALTGFGLDAQRRLRHSAVLCIGLGGLGSPATMYLAAAGIGRLGLVDPDVVDSSNLQRQVLHGESDIGRLKLESARETLSEINPHVELVPFQERFCRDNAQRIAAGFDLILDGTDNFATRYLSNDLAVLTGKPNVYGSIFRFEGQVSVFAPHLGGPCYRCLFPEPPAPGTVPSCAEGGVLGVLPGIIGSMQALEAIKLLTGIGTPLAGRLIHFDALHFRFREIKLRRDPHCALCGDAPTITGLVDYDQFCGIAPAGMQSGIPEISVRDLKPLLDAGRAYLIDVREPDEHQICHIPGSHLLPLSQLSERIQEVPRNAPLYIHCRSGIRSARAIGILEKHGITGATNVAGGIIAWAREFDPSMPVG